VIAGVPKNWLEIALTFRGSTLPHTWKRVLFTTAWAGAVTFFWQSMELSRFSLTVTPFSLIGVAISIFLGFRNNTSYDRFWEGRKLWGRMVNVSRTWARQVLTLIQAPPDASGPDKARARELAVILVHRQIAYVQALRMHLRDADWNTWRQLLRYLPEDEALGLEHESNRPAAITHRTGELLAEAWDQGWLHPMHLPTLEDSLTEITGVQGACERIKSTPVPWAYTVLTHRLVFIYCVTLPCGIEDTVGVLTPLVVALVSYAFYGLDAIGDEIEEPFGLDPNDLPLNYLSRMIEVNLRQRLGEEDIPPMIGPHDGVLD
jgi:putative membrane protein